MTQPLLSVRNLQVRFGTKTVVQDLSFDIQPGEKLALVGESGSGKTVSALSLLRLLPDAQLQGQAWFAPPGQADARDLLQLPEPALRAVRGAQIATIFQEPMSALNPLFTVGDQIAEVVALHQLLAPKAAWVRAVDLLASTGLAEPARRARAYPHQLSGGQRQRAMIAMALACNPSLLIADEPTTALDASVRQQVLALLDELQQRHGLAVLMITHDLPLVRRFADRVLVLQQGSLVEQGEVGAVFGQPQHAYTRQLLASRPSRSGLVDAGLVDAEPAPPQLSAQGLRVVYPVPRPGIAGWFKQAEFVALQGADFTLQPGRTLAVIGESGSGKSTLALAALGLLPCGGDLLVAGQRWQGRLLADRPLRRRVQVVFQDPFASLSPRRTVEEIVVEGLALHCPELPAAEQRQRVLATLADVGLDEQRFPGLLQRYPHAFSGGQRQRLALARALVMNPELLVLDEPTSALDVTIQQQVLTLLQRLQRERGLSYLLITHDMAVAAAMAHQVLVLKDGVVVESGPVQQVLNAPRNDYTRALLLAADCAEA